MTIFTSTMKSPDNTKKSLRCCASGAKFCYEKCPYGDSAQCIEHMCADALEYIEQLESRNIKPQASSLRLRLWRLFHPLKWRTMTKFRLDEMHEYTLIHREPAPNEAIITEEVRE